MSKIVKEAIKQAQHDLKYHYESIVLMVNGNETIKLYSTEAIDSLDTAIKFLSMKQYDIYDARKYDYYIINQDNYVDILCDEDLATKFLETEAIVFTHEDAFKHENKEYYFNDMSI